MPKTKLADYVVKYQRVQRNQGKADTTVKQNGYACTRFAAWYDKQRRSPSTLCQDDIEDYLYGSEGRAESGVSAASFNTELAHLRGFLTWLARKSVCRNDVLDALISRPVEKQSYARASMGQIEQMITGCEDEWERWVMALASQTLGRAGELVPLTFASFNEQAQRLAYHRSKTRDLDEMPMTNMLSASLRRWKLFLQEQCGPIQPHWYAIPRRTHRYQAARKWEYHPDQKRTKHLSTVVQKHAARALGLNPDDLKGQGVHLIRRSMARALFDRLARDGEPDPLGVVQAMLGHANRKTTEIYIGLEHGRWRRNELLAGGDLLWTPQDETVVQLRTKEA